MRSPECRALTRISPTWLRTTRCLQAHHFSLEQCLWCAKQAVAWSTMGARLVASLQFAG